MSASGASQPPLAKYAPPSNALRPGPFSIPEVVSYISRMLPLAPGDLIAMGSPDGTGGSRTPPRFLKEGDVLEVEVPGVGVLKNQVGTI